MLYTKEDVIRDIELTRKELDAYSKLSSGYFTLVTLPEFDSKQKKSYLSQGQYYENLWVGCNKFLNDLYLIAKKEFDLDY